MSVVALADGTKCEYSARSQSTFSLTEPPGPVTIDVHRDVAAKNNITIPTSTDEEACLIFCNRLMRLSQASISFLTMLTCV
jgi:hypothetical protein